MFQNLAKILNKQNIAGLNTIQREPKIEEYDRWIDHSIMGRSYVFSQPVTFTPYASVKACSARCLFCSENLREIKSTQNSSLLRPEQNYFNYLEKTLSELQGLPISYSLSGLEMTDDPDWFSTLLNVLSRHRELSPIESSVLYSNAAGLADKKNDLVAQIAAFDFDWIEVSRHHFNEQINQKIMRFRPQLNIAENSVFFQVIQNLLLKTEVKLVCIVQSGGVDNIESVYKYLNWAKALGVKHVIFREFSKLNETYKKNSTYRYIESSRQSMFQLLEQLDLHSNLRDGINWLSTTNGYYFNNLQGIYGGTKVTFEHSDYTTMKRKHDSNRVYKLVFHANGNLCAGWLPDKHVLFRAAQED